MGKSSETRECPRCGEEAFEVTHHIDMTEEGECSECGYKEL